MALILRRIADWVPGIGSLRRLQRVERLTRRIDHFGMGSSSTYIGNNRILVRVVAGRHPLIFYVHADDKLLSPWFIADGIHERDLTDYFVRELKADSHSLDVGANFGYFACVMAKHSPRGRVIGIEPSPDIHALAVDNLFINALHEHGQMLHAAASDAAGEMTLFRRVGRSGNTSIAKVGEDFTRDMCEPPEEPFTVAALRIDDLRDKLSGRLDFMKLDVEGAEPLALRGASATIAANPQLQIMMEWAPGQVRHAGFDIAEFVREIAAAGLQPFALERKGDTRPISHDDLAGLPYQPGVLLRRQPG